MLTCYTWNKWSVVTLACVSFGGVVQWWLFVCICHFWYTSLHDISGDVRELMNWIVAAASRWAAVDSWNQSIHSPQTKNESSECVWSLIHRTEGDEQFVIVYNVRPPRSEQRRLTIKLRVCRCTPASAQTFPFKSVGSTHPRIKSRRHFANATHNWIAFYVCVCAHVAALWSKGILWIKPKSSKKESARPETHSAAAQRTRYFIACRRCKETSACITWV